MRHREVERIHFKMISIPLHSLYFLQLPTKRQTIKKASRPPCLKPILGGIFEGIPALAEDVIPGAIIFLKYLQVFIILYFKNRKNK